MGRVENSTSVSRLLTELPKELRRRVDLPGIHRHFSLGGAMRGKLLASAFLLIAGCSDPETTILTVGSEVRLVADPGAPGVPIMVSITTEVGPGVKDFWIPADSRVVILEDKAAEPPVQPKLRLVRVRVVGGEHKGIEGKASRRHLRP
jgi:hypothetical protein